MASRAKKPPGDEGVPTRPARLRVMRPEVEEVLRSPRRGRPKLKEGGGEGAAEDDDSAAPPRYDCGFQDEKDGGEFAPPEMVWCKVRSHPWWPAQVFDVADASEQALQHARSGGGAPLVAYFWDRTFAWSDPSALLPFRANFPRLAGQSSVLNYVYAVDTALEEVERRVEAGLSCACFPNARQRQEVRNSGIREGAYGAVVDEAYMRDTFRGEPFLEYISALGRNPLAGADRLDLATAKAQLRSFNRLRVPRELPEFATFESIEDVPAETSPHTKRKRMEKTSEDDVLSKEKKSRRGESSLRKRDAAKEEAVDEDSSVPRKSSARKKTSKDVDKTESPAKKDAMVEDSSKQSKSKISKSSAEKKKKDSSKDTDKGESLPEPAESSKERKSKTSKSSAKTKKKDSFKDTDKGESPPEPAVEDDTNEDSSMPSEEATDGTLTMERKSKTSKSSTKAKKKDISKDADKEESLPDPAKEEATGDDSSTPGATDGTLSKEGKSKISKSPAKKKKQDTSKDTDGVETVGGSKTPVEKAMDGTLSESKSARRLRSMQKTDDASEGSKGLGKNDVGETTKGKDKDAPLLKENNLGRRASSAQQKDKITADGDGLADSSIKDSVSPGKKKSQLGESSATKDAPISISEHGRKKKKLSDLLVETGTPNRSPGGKSKARGKRSLPASTEEPDRDIEDIMKTRGKRSLPASTEKPEDADRDTKDTPKTRGKRSLPASTEKSEDPVRDTNDAMKTRGKRSLLESTEEPEDPDRDTNATMKTRKRKKLDTLGDLSSQPPLSPKGSTKGREATPKAAGKKSQASPVVKANGDTLGDLSSQPQPLTPKRSTKGREATPKAVGKKSQESPAVKANGTLGDLSSQPQPLTPKRSTKVREATPKAAGKKSQASPVVKANDDTLGDSSSQPQPLTPKRSTKAREATPKAAGKKSQASPVVKSNGDTLGDLSSQPQPLTPKRSTKARESTRQAAELKPHTSPVVKANGEASQTRSRRTKNSEETVPDKSPRSVKPNKGKKGATTEDTLSCGEMHSQLRLAASDLKKVGKITPASVSFFTEFSKSSCPPSSDVEEEIPIEAANADNYASSPNADEEIPEESGKKVSSPHADEEIPEKATDNEPSPSEPPVAEHMKDDYWADILINVEEPISSLRKKKDKSKSKTSKTKEDQAEDAAKEPSVSARNVEVEEPKAAEPKQDNTENGKAETKPPSVANGGQPNAEELSGLVLHFSRPDAVPSHGDLIKIFSQYGPVSEARTETGDSGNSAQVVFRRRMDAEAAFGGSGKMTAALGPALVSFRLTDFPSGGGASGNGPREGAPE